MGKAFSKVLGKLKGKKNYRLVLVGLDSAGKTTILYMLKLGELCHTIPTIGFNVETIQYKNIRLDCWDAGGQEVFRSMWSHYCSDCNGLMFVIDSSDAERLTEAKDELMRLMGENTMNQTAVLIIANKQDMPNAVPPKEIEARLELAKLKQPYHVQAAVATSGEGLLEGLDWLVEEVKKV